MENDKTYSATAAQAALDSVSATRAQVASRVESPWWYHVGLGASVALAFTSIDVGGSMMPSGLIVGAILAPPALAWSAARSRGVAIANPLNTPGARGLYGFYLLLLGVLATVGLVLQIGFDLDGPMSVAGVLAFVLTTVVSRRADDALTQDVRAGA
ncbi:hypothetical protein ACQEVX_18365 [Streptomyces syringium]|uniref:hypothetical protein n=1 Tax=Streptomyces syringium TaxID=76729 RepID=UPI003D8C3B2E